MADFAATVSLATRDISTDALMERIQSNFKLLKTSSVDESSLNEDLEDLSEGFKELGSALTTEYEWFQKFLFEVRSVERRNLFLAKLQEDPEELAETRSRLLQGEGLAQETGNIIEVVYKITASRNLLGRLENPALQRSMSQSLSKISVAQDRVFEMRRGLVEALDELGRWGISSKLVDDGPESEERMNAAQSAARFAVKRLTGNDRQEKSPAPHSASRTDSGPVAPEHRDPVIPKLAAKSAREESAVDAKPLAEKSGSLPMPAEAEQARIAMNMWSKWKPFAARDIGNAVRFVNATHEEAIVIRIQSLVGERNWNNETARENASARLKKGGSVWDLPASPPPQYSSATEESDYCETGYRPHNLEHILYAGNVPPELLRRVTGKVLLQEEFSSCHAGIVKPNLEERCLKALSAWTSENDRVSEYYSPGAAASNDRASTRLVRSAVDVDSIPVLRLQCELRLGTALHVFEAWVCGEEKTLHLGSIPKTWTWKTTAWLTSISLLGVPVGYLLAGLG